MICIPKAFIMKTNDIRENYVYNIQIKYLSYTGSKQVNYQK